MLSCLLAPAAEFANIRFLLIYFLILTKLKYILLGIFTKSQFFYLKTHIRSHPVIVRIRLTYMKNNEK